MKRTVCNFRKLEKDRDSDEPAYNSEYSLGIKHGSACHIISCCLLAQLCFRPENGGAIFQRYIS
jgi:hypothetical protein